MGKESKIEWCDSSWNPIRGCTKISQGCKNCYAETFAERWRGVPGHPFEQGFDLKLIPHKLGEPVKWKEPKRIFVNSMSDLFHDGVPFEYICKVFAVMGIENRHTYQILTKRPERMREFMTGKDRHKEILEAYFELNSQKVLKTTMVDGRGGWFPLENVWLGTSVENADVLHRIDTLRQTPAALRFLSIEPLLGPLGKLNLEGIGWVIVGGESGPGARPMHPDWVREIRDQCQAAGVSFFFKQWGEWIPSGQRLDGIVNPRAIFGDAFPAKKGKTNWPVHEFERDLLISFKIGKKLTGRLLDGREWNEMPQLEMVQ